MKAHIPFAVVLLIFSACSNLLFGSEPQELRSEISAATVYAGVARVTRSAELPVTPGSPSLVLRDLPLWIDSDNVLARLDPADVIRLQGVRVQRVHVPGVSKADLKAAEKILATLQERLKQTQSDSKDALAALAEERVYLDKLMPWYAGRLPEESKTRPVTAAELRAVNDYLSEARTALVEKTKKLKATVRQAEEAVAEQQKIITELQAKPSRENTEIFLDIDVKSAVTAKIDVSYLVGGATWHARYALFREAGNDKITVRSQAVVQQATGEPWPAIPITVSTSDPLLRGTSSSLKPWFIDVPGTDAVPRQSATATLLSTWQEKTAADEKGKAAVANVLKAREKTREMLQKLTLRGLSHEFTSQAAFACDTTGVPATIVLNEGVFPCTASARLIPALATNCFETVHLKNNGSDVLLPGQAAVFRDRQFTSHSSVPFAGLGETVAIPLTRSPAVTATRTLDLEHSRKAVVGARTNLLLAYTFTVKNHSEATIETELLDQLPVTANKDLRIQLTTTQPRAQSGPDNVVCWNFSLKPKEERTLVLRFEIEGASGKIPAVLTQNLPVAQ